MPAACAAVSADATWTAMSRASRIGSRRTAQSLPQRLALDVLHRDELLAVRRFAERVDGADVRMIERGGGTRLLPEPRDAVRVSRQVRAQNLERDHTARA